MESREDMAPVAEFIASLDKALKELLMLGYSIVEDSYLVEINSLEHLSSQLGFDTVSALLGQLYSACNAYVQDSSEIHALSITKSIAVLQFAIASLNLGVDRSYQQRVDLNQLFLESDEQE